MPSQVIRIEESTHAWLAEEAKRRKTSVSALVSEAVQKLKEAAFWESARAAASALRTTPDAWALEKQERRLWESLDGPVERPTRRRNSAR